MRPEDIITVNKHALQPGQRFCFHCTQCGDCCRHREDILLTPYDLFRIAGHLGITPGEVVKTYCEVYLGSSSHFPVVRLLPVGDEKACPFLKENRCSIHASKPTVCALFPLGRVMQYGALKEAEKMIGSIRGVCSGELSHYRFDGAKRLFTMENQVHFEVLRYQKTALFVHISDVDRSMDRLVALFYEQLFRILIKSKERENQPFYPVHVILDDFACGCRVADFESIISVIRSRGIYVSAAIQSIAQLETKYKERSSTIVENCDTVLYLGGNDPQTARLIAERANKPIHEILSMPVGDMLLIQRGQPVRKVKRYALEEHCEVIDRASERREEMTGMENEGICV